MADEEILRKEDVEEAMILLDLSRTTLYKLILRYRQRPQTSAAALMREVKRRFFEQQLAAPAHRTVRRRVEAE